MRLQQSTPRVFLWKGMLYVMFLLAEVARNGGVGGGGGGGGLA